MGSNETVVRRRSVDDADHFVPLDTVALASADTVMLSAGFKIWLAVHMQTRCSTKKTNPSAKATDKMSSEPANPPCGFRAIKSFVHRHF